MTLLLIETLKEVVNIMTAIGAVGTAIGLGIYSFRNTGTKELKKNVDSMVSDLSNINHNIDGTKNELYEIRKTILVSDSNNSSDHKKIFEHIDQTSEVVENIINKSNIDRALDDIISNAQIFTENDNIMAAFFELCGVLIKRNTYELIKYSIDKLTKEEIVAKIEYMKFQVRDFYSQFDDGFITNARPHLINLIQNYQNTLLEIKADVLNDKNLRIKLAGINLLQHTYSFLVQERTKWKEKHK